MGKRTNKNVGRASSSACPLSNAPTAPNQSSQTKQKKNDIPSHLLARTMSTNKNQQPCYRFGKISCLNPGTVWVQSHFCSPQECQEWIAWSHHGKDEWEHTAQRATRYMAHRECYRIQRNDKRVAQAIFDRLDQSGLLARIQQELVFADENYRPVACNPNIRLYKYDKNHSFGKHIDGSNQTFAGQTEITLLVYLSECQGGATRFYRQTGKSSSFSFAPQVGAILLHVHGDRCLEHEADPVLSGTKYVLRSDICYRRI